MNRSGYTTAIIAVAVFDHAVSSGDSIQDEEEENFLNDGV